MDTESSQGVATPGGGSNKLLIALAALGLLLILAGVVWFLFAKPGEEGTNEQVFPFGAPSEETPRSPTDIVPSDEDGGSGNTTYESSGDGLFRRLSEKAVAGAFVFERSGITTIRYVERETGHIYEISGPGEATQLTNTTVPRISEAFFADNGNAVILRYAEDDPLSGRQVIKTSLAGLRLPNASSSDVGGSLAMKFLPDNIIAVSVSPDGRSMFYLMRSSSGSVGYLFSVSTEASKEVFRHSITEFLPELLDNGNVILTTKASANISGYAYRYDPKNSSLTPLLRAKKALTTRASRDGARVLFGENIAGATHLGAYSSAGFTGDEGVILNEIALQIAALPEKCSWNTDSVRVVCGSFINNSVFFPDAWYQGRITLNDTFWSVNTDTGEIAYIADPKKEAGRSFDVTNPLLSPDGRSFIFTDKKDGTLWELRIIASVTSEASTLSGTTADASGEEGQVEPVPSTDPQ